MTFDEAIDYLEDSSYDVERTIEAVAALREVQAALAAALPAGPSETSARPDKWTAENIVEELNALSECDHDFCRWCNYDSDAELHTDGCLLAIVEKSLAAQPKAPSPTPGEVEEAIRFLEADGLMVSDVDETPICDRCGAAWFEGNVFSHNPGCPVAKRVATLRAALPAGPSEFDYTEFNRLAEAKDAAQPKAPSPTPGEVDGG